MVALLALTPKLTMNDFGVFSEYFFALAQL